MPAKRHGFGVLLLLAVLLASCGPERATPSPRESAPVATSPKSTKRLVTAVAGDPYTLSAKLNTSGPGSNVAGADALEDLVNAGLANVDNQGQLHPVLAEAAPSIENGLWKAFPDGRMETTWKLRPGLFWHDGAPFTTDDLVFTTQVSQDREVGWERDAAFDAVESVAAPDERTLIVMWKRPFIEADTLFSHAISGRTVPLPKHILERTFTDDKANLMNHSYWSDEFIGTGPFMLQSWERGSHLVTVANDHYVLGRPKIDEVEVRFIPDPRTLTANILAGTIDLTLGRGISLEQATQIRDQWGGGHMDLRLSNWLVMFPQLLDPTPAAVSNLQFRRALLGALDRQQMVDTFQYGLTSVGNTYLNPQDPAYAEIAPAVTRYEYDPRKSMQMIEDLHYAQGPDGIYRDATSQPLSLEVRVGGGDDLTEKATLAVADSWRRVGVAAEALIVPSQRIRDREFTATFPAFYLRQNPNDPARLGRFHSAQRPLPDNRYTGDNSPRYANPEFDALLERYSATVPLPARRQILGQIVNHIADQVIMMGLFYISEPTLIANRVQNASARPPNSTQAWNAHEWDVNQ